TLRPDATGVSPDAISAGSYINPLAFAAPVAGQWGSAGRNSISGPGQFLLNAGVQRTFRVGPRLDLDWRIDATNVFNRVTFASVSTLFGGPEFGLPNRANPMRRIQSSLRLRFNTDRSAGR